MNIVRLVALLVAFCWQQVLASERRTSPCDGDAAVMSWANSAGLDATAAAAKYQQLIGQNYQEALAALEYFENRKAYGVFAAAMVSAKISGISGECIHILGRDDAATRASVHCAILQLERLNAIEPNVNDDERAAGIGNMKAMLAAMIARTLNAPAPRSAPRTADTRPMYAEFIAAAKRKPAAALIP